MSVQDRQPEGQSGSIRPTAVAGTFYPDRPEVLAAMVEGFLAAAEAELPPAMAQSWPKASTDNQWPKARPKKKWPKAIVAPHAGYVYSGSVAASAYVRLKPAAGTVTRVILAGPCHRVPVRGIALPTVAAFDSPLGPIQLDTAALAHLAQSPVCQWQDEAHAAEHALEVHVPFIQQVLGPDVQLVPLVVGAIAPRDMQQILDQVWGGPETVVVISSDLSHFLGYEAAQEIDHRTRVAIECLRPDQIEDAGACGRMPLKGLLLQAQQRDLRISTLDVRNSGDTAGPVDHVVGYGAWMLEHAKDARLSAADRAVALKTVAQSLDYALHHEGRLPHIALESFSPALQAHRACFVTIHKNHQLRGCIGSLVAHRPLAVDLVENAVKAGFQDPRFPQLMPPEMPHLSIEVSILGAPAELTFMDEADLLTQLTPHEDGVIFKDGARQSVFLPHVWEALQDKAHFMAQLKRKAGLAPDHWSEGVQVFRFSTETFCQHSDL